jgi:predicted MFS family arabinose efflux permease
VHSARNNIGVGVASLCLVQFTDVLGVTVVVTALPRMLTDLHASPDAGSLIATGYAMFFSGFWMLGARLGDRFGHRRVILCGLLVFAVGAAIGASATTVAILTTARCLQGAAAAGSVPSALRLLTTITAEGQQRRRAVAAWSAAGAAAGASGFVVGGVVTDVAGWRLIFWGYLPVALILAAGIGRTVPPDRNAERPPPLPVASSLLFTASVMGFVIATTLLPQKRAWPAGAALLGAILVLAGAFVVVDRSAQAPLLPRSLLRERPLRQGAIASLLNTLTTSSTITLATLYLQNTRGLSPLTAAAVLLPFSLAVIAGSALAARSLARWPPQRVIAVGLSAIAICDAALISSAAGAWTVPITVVAGGEAVSGSLRWPRPAWERASPNATVQPPPASSTPRPSSARP